jgi:23S rRNA (uracil-5-)-methyltransferase RumA
MFDRESPGKVHCEHASRCVGCPLIHLDYAEQLESKGQRVRDATALYPDLGYLPVENVVPADPVVSYRGRAKLIVGWSSEGAGSPTIGLYAADHQVVDIPHCRVLRPLLADFTSGLRQLLRDPPRAAGGCLVPEATGGCLSAFDLREAVDERRGLLVTFVVRAGRPIAGGHLSATVTALRSLSESVLGVAVNYREPKSPQLLGARTEALWGANAVRDRSRGSYQIATFGSFSQAHRGQSEKIQTLVAARLDRLELGRELRLLDLYGGTGAASLSFAQRGARVTLIESFAPAAECARRAAAELGLDGVEIRVGDAGQVIRALSAEGAAFDVVLANPPRRGMAPAVRKAIAGMVPRAVAYISCDPDTLARDLVHLAQLGYKAEKIQPVDMIPLTDQVESVAILLRAEPPPARTLYEDDDIRILEKPGHAPPVALRDDERLLWGIAEQASGISVWSKRSGSFAVFGAALREPGARQLHIALSKGTTHKKGKLGSKARYERLTPAGGHSLLKVTTEQAPSYTLLLRQLARIGHPVVGDSRYGHAPTNRHFEEKYALDRLFMHTIGLQFVHPRSRALIRVDAALPGDLGLVLRRLGYLASMSPNEW